MRTPECHPDRPYQARKMCQPCYQSWYDQNKRPERERKAQYDPNYRRPPRKPARIPDCHPEKKHAAHGKCHMCYQRGLAERPRAKCHPERAHLAHGLCQACHSKNRYWGDPETAKRLQRESGARVRARARTELIEAYGGRCACLRCPETNPAFLTLDHINGGGRRHRMKIGSHMYQELRRQGWPKEEYRLLCWNCNAMTRYGKTCPHEESG